MLQTESATQSRIEFELKPSRIIFPTREGELIDDPREIAIGNEYSLTYPGTASMKCVAVFQDEFNVLIGGEPSFEYTRITLRRVDERTFRLSFLSKSHHYLLLPFCADWKDAADVYKRHFGCTGEDVAVDRKPRYMLQLGVKDSFGNVHIDDFEDLMPAIDLFHKHFGDRNIVHFFGTNKAGFDRMFPDFTIDPAIGGDASLNRLLEHAKFLNLLTSQHYNPRIADTDWMAQHPQFRDGIVARDGQEVVEPYKDHPHFVMNPNNEQWFSKCFETVDYLNSVGFDYLEIDQFTYQRNFYDPSNPLALGYRKMVDEFVRRGIKFWLEGVSDIFRLPEGNFYQILIRDKSQLWPDQENRRGYPYGRTFGEFFMHFYPDSEVSYQIFTEHKFFDLITGRYDSANQKKAAVYDIELGFYDKSYIGNLKKVIGILRNHGAI